MIVDGQYKCFVCELLVAFVAVLLFYPLHTAHSSIVDKKYRTGSTV